MAVIVEEVVDGKKLKLLKEYPSEILVSILIIAVLGIWTKQVQTENKVDALQSEMKTYLNQDRQLLLQSVNNNSEVMKQNTKVLSDVSDFLRIQETREALK